MPRPHDWIDRVNASLTKAEMTAVKNSIRRGTPFGTSLWVRETADQLDLGHTLRRCGRPCIAVVGSS